LDRCGRRPRRVPGTEFAARHGSCGWPEHRLDGAWPLDDAAAAELADRRDRWAVALAGKGWSPPQPMEPRGRRVRP
jgi:hypothetical protein